MGPKIVDESLETLIAGGVPRAPLDELADRAQAAVTRALERGDAREALLAAADIGARAAEEVSVVGEARGVRRLPVACHKGCSHCCRLVVTITETEALVLAAELPPGDPRRAALAAPRPHRLDERLQSGMSCALLASDGSCSVHAVRPLACRAATSLDERACVSAIETSGGDVPIHVVQFVTMRAAYLGYRRALAAAHLDPERRELHATTSASLEHVSSHEAARRPSPSHAAIE